MSSNVSNNHYENKFLQFVNNYDRDVDKNSDDDKNSEVIYTNEQKVVTAVWVHEKEFNNQTLEDIRNNFKIRFKVEPPKTEVLTIWENQLFSKGEINTDDQSNGSKENFNIDEQLSDEGSSEEDDSD